MPLPIEVVPVLGTVLIVFALSTAFRLVLKIVPVPEHRARAPSLNRALAESPGLTTFIFLRNPESDICVQVFILYPTHKQTELVKQKFI